VNKKVKRKRKRNLNEKRIIFVLIIVALGFYSLTQFNFPTVKNNLTNINNVFCAHSDYDIIKQDTNPNYYGIGQKTVQGKDGYITTFTTEKNKIYKEYKQNGNSSWSNNKYWDNTMETDGCGITAISIILSGYGKNVTPEDLRKKYYPVLNGDRISSVLSDTFGVDNSDFLYDSSSLSNEVITKHLKKDKPVLICVWNKPNNNRWTTASHYMVLLASDGNDMVYISNPNGLENSSKSSGWYNISEVSPYIAKALFVEE